MVTTEALQEAISRTNKVFESFPSSLPEPPHRFKRELEALTEAKLPLQRSKLIFDMRCWQAEQVGFKRMTLPEATEVMMGAPHTETHTGPDRMTTEWRYDHHEDKEYVNDNWGQKPPQYARTERQSLWFMPPFAKREVWRCQYGYFNYLKREVPYGVVLRLIEAKKLKLFNGFGILAPMECWLTDADMDPIVMGEVWELPPMVDGHQTSGREAHFFVGQWK